MISYIKHSSVLSIAASIPRNKTPVPSCSTTYPRILFLFPDFLFLCFLLRFFLASPQIEKYWNSAGSNRRKKLEAVNAFHHFLDSLAIFFSLCTFNVWINHPIICLHYRRSVFVVFFYFPVRSSPIFWECHTLAWSMI